MANTIVGTVELIAKIDTGNYKKGAAEIDSANKKIEGSTDKTNNSLVKLARNGLKVAVVGVAGLATAIGAMTIKGGISRALNIEDAQAKLKGLGHDAQSVEDIMESALASVKGTAYGLDAAATLAATAVAAGVKPGQQLTKYLGTAADAATIAGVSLSEMGSIFNKVQTQQRAYTMEINQLADRGIPIYQWLQDELGVTQEALRKMVAAGEVDSATYFKVIQKNIGGAALESGKTTRGAWANLLAAMSRVGARIVSGPINDVRKGFGDVTKWIDDNADTIVRSVQKTMDITVKFAQGLYDVGRAAWELRMPIFLLATSLAAYRAAVIATNAVAAVQRTLFAATQTQVVLMNGSFVALRTSTVAATVAQGALNTVMRLNPIGLVVGAVAGLTAAYIAVTRQSNSTKSATDRLNDARREEARAADAAKDANDRLKGAQLSAEGSALAVERAQKSYNEAVRQYGPKSLEAREAAHQLKRAQDDLARANREVKSSTDEARKAQEKIAKIKDVIKQANAEIASSASGVAGSYQTITARVQEAQREMSKSPTRTGVAPSKSLIPSILGRASGGPVRANTPYLVGENPDGSLNSTSELFVPNSAGRIISARNLQGSLGGGGITNNIQNVTISSEVDGERWLRRLSGNQEIVSNGLVPTQSYM